MNNIEEKEEIKEEETISEEPKEPAREEQVSQGVSEDLLKKMVSLCESQSETIVNLKTRLGELEEKHSQLNSEYKSDKPINIQAQVMGTYNFNTRQEKMLVDNYNESKEYARKLDNMIKSKYPRI